jgi:hypothetical protein
MTGGAGRVYSEKQQLPKSEIMSSIQKKARKSKRDEEKRNKMLYEDDG